MFILFLLNLVILFSGHVNCNNNYYHRDNHNKQENNNQIILPYQISYGFCLEVDQNTGNIYYAYSNSVTVYNLNGSVINKVYYNLNSSQTITGLYITTSTTPQYIVLTSSGYNMFMFVDMNLNIINSVQVKTNSNFYWKAILNEDNQQLVIIGEKQTIYNSTLYSISKHGHIVNFYNFGFGLSTVAVDYYSKKILTNTITNAGYDDFVFILNYELQLVKIIILPKNSKPVNYITIGYKGNILLYGFNEYLYYNSYGKMLQSNVTDYIIDHVSYYPTKEYYLITYYFSNFKITKDSTIKSENENQYQNYCYVSFVDKNLKTVYTIFTNEIYGNIYNTLYYKTGNYMIWGQKLINNTINVVLLIF